jgi:hypothetical protein
VKSEKWRAKSAAIGPIKGLKGKERLDFAEGRSLRREDAVSDHSLFTNDYSLPLTCHDFDRSKGEIF